jgi:hypothetical protein
MFFDFIYRMLSRLLAKKKHDVLKLKWEKAKLEQMLNK